LNGVGCCTKAEARLGRSSLPVSGGLADI
jgi:hypothetical protein